MPSKLSLCYSLADQAFHRAKSIGIFNFAFGLLNALASRPETGRLHLLGNRTLRTRLAGFEGATVSEHDEAIKGRLGRLWWDQAAVLRAARQSGCDWLLLPKGFVPFLAGTNVRIAACVHDTLQCHYRQHYPDIARWEMIYFTAALRATLKRAQVIFTISEFSRGEILRHAAEWNLRPRAVIVAGIGFAPPLSSTIEKSESLVCLTSRLPHKRTDLAVNYLARWQRDQNYAGTIHWIGATPPGLVWPDSPNWRRHPRLEDDAYQRLMAGARALVFFTEYEGFGMPPVEATRVGTCPVYSRLPVTEETMGGLGHPFDNASYASFKAALNQALQTPMEAVMAWAEMLIARHNWSAVASRVVRGLADAESARRAQSPK
jgi:hypothetical protein